MPNRKGQRREPAADDVRFVSERIRWLPFAAPPGSAFRHFSLMLFGNTSKTFWGQEDITALENAETLLCFSE